LIVRSSHWTVVKSLCASLLGLLIWASPSLVHAQATDLPGSLAAQGSLGQFRQALDTAGLTDMLRGPGPLTVWAPVDAAFGKLSPVVRQKLQDPAVLKQVLQYHLAPGVVTAAQIVQVPNVRTVEGEQVRITAANGGVLINDSRVVQPDLAATNGIIHVIDTILVPPSLVSALPNTGVVDAPSWPLGLTGLGAVIAAVGIALRRRAATPTPLPSRAGQLGR
jgi:uncharacterized surface protein with fasciclin (FAS1) repeats